MQSTLKETNATIHRYKAIEQEMGAKISNMFQEMQPVTDPEFIRQVVVEPNLTLRIAQRKLAKQLRPDS